QPIPQREPTPQPPQQQQQAAATTVTTTRPRRMIIDDSGDVPLPFDLPGKPTEEETRQQQEDVIPLRRGGTIRKGTSHAVIIGGAKAAAKPIPQLPKTVVKRMASRMSERRKLRLSKEAIEAVMDAGNKFFVQVAKDLAAYATHAKRKTVESSDID